MRAPTRAASGSGESGEEKEEEKEEGEWADRQQTKADDRDVAGASGRDRSPAVRTN